MKPDTVLVALTFADDSVGIMAFVTTEYRGNDPVWSRPPTPANIEAEIAKASASFDAVQLPVRSWRLVAREELPADRTYRNALRDDKKAGLTHDMVKARSIHRDLIREARAPRLAELDVQYLRATETADPVAEEIVREKQVLRDATADPRIEAAQTIEELKAVWPKSLEGR